MQLITRNNFAKRKPTVILMQESEDDEPQVLTYPNGEPHVFPTYFAALQHIKEFADDDQVEHLKFANYEPKIGGGDVEDTGGKKCLKCGEQVVASNKVERQKVNGQVVQVEAFMCPRCDK